MWAQITTIRRQNTTNTRQLTIARLPDIMKRATTS